MKRFEILSCLPDADVLLVVPPFWNLDHPCLAVHLLQACARRAGFRVAVLYANLLFAARIGEESYLEVMRARGSAATRWFFVPAAFDLPPSRLASPQELDAQLLEEIASSSTAPHARAVSEGRRAMAAEHSRIDAQAILRIADEAGPWVEGVSSAIGEKGYRVVGCTSMFHQLPVSLALLNRVKARSPGTVTILGGNSCEGEMAEGIASIGARIDYVFSGESESAFPELLGAVFDGRPPAGPVVRGVVCTDLDSLPPARFEEFFEQRACALPSSEIPSHGVEIPYETSRGCDWGERSKCAFCGLPPDRTRYRVKSLDRIVADMKALVARSPTRRIRMTDSTLPTGHLPLLMERLASEVPPLEIFCEVRPDLGLGEMLSMKRGGVVEVQAGIESLASALLKRMRKGTTLRTNLAFLRHARVCGIAVNWNLLWGFPGDEAKDYEETLDLAGRLHHLPPPLDFIPLCIARFSPYFEHAGEHGITNLRPRGELESFLPPHADAWKIARRFAADFSSGALSNMDLILRLHRAVEEWRSYWRASVLRPLGQVPSLSVVKEAEDRFRLIDTRGLAGTEPESILDRRQASLALVARPFEPSPETDRAVRANLAVACDGWLIPLATARAETLLEFEESPCDGAGRRPPVPSAPSPSGLLLPE